MPNSVTPISSNADNVLLFVEVNSDDRPLVLTSEDGPRNSVAAEADIGALCRRVDFDNRRF